ncbi:MAG: SDR family NAD(P)-dependent oxidoreductase [Aureispira sp.]
MTIKVKYGTRALVAGGSEGIGAAFAHYLAKEGLDLVLVARRAAKLEAMAKTLREQYKVEVTTISCDLARVEAVEELEAQLAPQPIDVLIYNAAIPFIGPFETDTTFHNRQIAQANMITPMNLVHSLGKRMLEQQKGAVVLMASMAGFQGSGFLAAYAASKAFNRVLAESLWYEWKDQGVDVMGCCAGATATPNYIETKPKATNFFAPKVQSPEAVVEECFQQLGKQPSMIPGRGNRIASFFMQRLLPRKLAVKIMGDTARQMYGF